MPPRPQRGADAAGGALAATALAGDFGNVNGPFWPHADNTIAAANGPTADLPMTRAAKLTCLAAMR